RQILILLPTPNLSLLLTLSLTLSLTRIFPNQRTKKPAPLRGFSFHKKRNQSFARRLLQPQYETKPAPNNPIKKLAGSGVVDGGGSTGGGPIGGTSPWPPGGGGG